MQRQFIQAAAIIMKFVPNSVKKGIVQALAKDELFAKQYGRKAMSAFSSHAGISAVIANGRYGNIISAPNDFAVHKIYAETGEWATSTTDIVKDFFNHQNKSGCFLDIGANIGMTTIPIVQEFPDVFCISFEPEPTNFANLKNNLLINCSTSNYEIIQAAIFKENSEISFEIADGNLGDHRLRTNTDRSGQDNEHLRKSIQVKAVPLDNFFQDIKGPLAVKIDVQGAEPFVFQGGAKVLEKADLVIIEWSPYMMHRLGGNIDDILNFISDHFNRCEIQVAEGHGSSKKYSISEATTFLRESFERDRIESDKYFDLILTK